ncbi:hypothetical protein MKW98_019329 [Papaver atlanticum]|uniref:Uncharacterized protein n=1 Tax=Papaver atlanticum TaxID=357466 RepID=A0AAD4SAP6_9MAGN|nr:hypothetical protein MKW98_019329 [Papaver atlanticum]
MLRYVDKSITLKASDGLNGMKLGGEVLSVVQATPDASIVGGIEEPPHFAIPEHAKPQFSKATKVLKLHNVTGTKKEGSCHCTLCQTISANVIAISSTNISRSIHPIPVSCAAT